MKWSTAFKIIGIYTVGWGICFGYVRIRDRWVEAHRPPEQTEAEIRQEARDSAKAERVQMEETLKDIDVRGKRTMCDFEAWDKTNALKLDRNEVIKESHDKFYADCLKKVGVAIANY